MAKRLIPCFNRVLVEKIIPPSKTSAGILLPEASSKVTISTLYFLDLDPVCTYMGHGPENVWRFMYFNAISNYTNKWNLHLFYVFILPLHMHIIPLLCNCILDVNLRSFTSLEDYNQSLEPSCYLLDFIHFQSKRKIYRNLRAFYLLLDPWIITLLGRH